MKHIKIFRGGLSEVKNEPEKNEKSPLTAAIIAEYNPFHNGHRYHIEQTRALTGATRIVVVMSGNFTQRGDVAILPKHERARAALSGGADLVIELPVAFALSSAEQFAVGAVAILNALGCVDILSFGSECGEVEPLKEAAGAVHYAQTTDKFFAEMQRGKSYPAALQSAVEEFYTHDVVEILAHPNNTLAVEYIKALNELGSRIQPFTIPRKGAAHDEKCTSSDPQCSILSAMQIRSYLLSGNDVAAFTPMDLGDENHNLADIRRLEVAVLARLRTMSPKEMQKAPNVQGGLENRLYKAAKAARSLSELYFLTKTKRYTLARIRRAVMCCFLGITHSDVKLKPQYLRVLAMNETGKAILSSAKESTLPIDTSLAALAKKSEGAARQALLEDRCTNVYGLALEKRRVCGHEFTEKFVNR